MKIIQHISFTIIIIGFSSFLIAPDWGFFGHRKINRMAVFTLPQDMIKFYKKNIEYITEHAVDPDKRRYATKHEAVRHYIDIDYWGDKPFQKVPKIFEDALIKYSNFYYLSDNDTVKIKVDYTRDTIFQKIGSDKYVIDTDSFRLLFRTYVMPQYYEDSWSIKADTVQLLFPGVDDNIESVYIEDHFSEKGILPYHMNSMYYWLVKAFTEKDENKILRLSSEFGHYIGDAHVPLHTTENYNGQFTDQIGIHAFWESRLPELFADEEYSFLVGRAEYIDQPLRYFWNMVYESHMLLDEVLEYELELKKVFPEDQQLCYDERLERTIRTQCPEFAEAYHDKLNGMVEDRMQDAILAIGSVWYSAWVDAGQPNLSKFGKLNIEAEEIKANPNINTRDHSF